MSKFKTGTRYLVAIFLVVFPVSALSTPPLDGQQILRDRMALYRQAIPNIKFIHTVGGEHWRQEYDQIISLLGEAPDALDYEHPPKFAKDLLLVTLHRLVTVLQHRVVSETLFRTDQQSPLKGAKLCVITLDPDELLANDMAATGFMINLPDSILSRISPERRLDPQDFLRFAVDHEIYHCLDSAFFGGAPMTGDTYGGEYNQYRRENSADAFALAMHLRQAITSPRFTQNLLLIRSLWFLDGGPGYRTVDSLRMIMKLPQPELKKKSIMELVHLANKVRNATSTGYEKFLDNQATALRAAEELGYEPSDYGAIWASLAQRDTDSRRVAKMAGKYLVLYSRLFDDKPIDFETEGSLH